MAEARTPRPYDHAETVNDYYSICSEFMQFGWSESLHFAPLRPGESLDDSILRHQRLMIGKLRLREGMTVIDVGCGVGGPMRRVARETGARVVCLNNNEQQLEKAKRRNVEAGLDHLAEYAHCSFMDMSRFEPDSFDAGYAIESTCHAPDKQGAFAEIFRVLKPGALFWGQEMCLTEKFDPHSARHRDIKRELMHGIALNGIATFGEVDQALQAVGFEVVGGRDMGVQEAAGHALVSADGGRNRNVPESPAQDAGGPKGNARHGEARRGRSDTSRRAPTP